MKLKVIVLFILSIFILIVTPQLDAKNLNLENPILVLGPDDAETPRVGKTYYKIHNFYRVGDVLVSEDDKVYVLEVGNACVDCFNLKGEFLFKVGRIGQGPSEFYLPSELAFVGPHLWVVDFKNNRIQEFRNENQEIKYVRPIKPTRINMPRHIAVIGDNVFLASTSVNSMFNGIAVLDFKGNFKTLIKIDPGFKMHKTLSLWSMAKIVGLTDKRLLVGYKYAPLVVLVDQNLKKLKKVDLSKYYSRYEDKKADGVAFPKGFSATAFSSGPGNSILVAACDNKRRRCFRVLQFNSDLSEKIGTVDLDFHIWEMKYYPKKNLMVFITGDDEVVIYNVQ